MTSVVSLSPSVARKMAFLNLELRDCHSWSQPRFLKNIGVPNPQPDIYTLTRFYTEHRKSVFFRNPQLIKSWRRLVTEKHHWQLHQGVTGCTATISDHHHCPA
jgi:hypothetical protein